MRVQPRYKYGTDIKGTWASLLSTQELFPGELLPEPVRRLIRVVSDHTEAPEEYLAAAGLFVGSVLAGRFAGLGSQFLNGFYLLVGPTGTSRKSTAQGFASRLLREVTSSLERTHRSGPDASGKEDVAELSGPTTAYPLVTHFSIEGLQTHAIGTNTSTGLLIYEYGNTFAVARRQGQQNTISELTAMFDGQPISVRTVGRKTDCSEYALSILAGSTPAWLHDFGASENVAGGLVNRHIPFSGAPNRLIAVPTEIDPVAWRGLVSDFAALVPADLRFLEGSTSEAPGRWVATPLLISLSPTATALWEAYYGKRTTQLREVRSDALREMAARELNHALKLAGLRAFLERRTEVDCPDLFFGVRLARWALRNTIDLIFEDIDSEGRKIEKRILRRLEHAGPQSKRQIAQYFGGKQGSLNQVLNRMVADGDVVCEQDRYSLGEPTSNMHLKEADDFCGESGICTLLQDLVLDESCNEMTRPGPNPVTETGENQDVPF